jgi:hypothetical protein
LTLAFFLRDSSDRWCGCSQTLSCYIVGYGFAVQVSAGVLFCCMFAMIVHHALIIQNFIQVSKMGWLGIISIPDLNFSMSLRRRCCIYLPPFKGLCGAEDAAMIDGAGPRISSASYCPWRSPLSWWFSSWFGIE